MISYDQIRAEYRAKYRAYKLELIDELSAQRDALNFTFSDLLNSKRARIQLRSATPAKSSNLS
ncbi:hypothetical protein K6028_26545 (plasmid) [Raoultella planticola]|nr:hypothetical protein K6028_26545 [Raoultella planticola]